MVVPYHIFVVLPSISKSLKTHWFTHRRPLIDDPFKLDQVMVSPVHKGPKATQQRVNVI